MGFIELLGENEQMQIHPTQENRVLWVLTSLRRSGNAYWHTIPGPRTQECLLAPLLGLLGTLNLLDKNINPNLAIEQFVISLPEIASEAS